ncbi:MAG TPA: hypothetical protein VGM77_07375 [Gemmatimonadales bacterium]|jgi:hypothetical protein
MPPTQSTCVSCGQQFAQNGELAAIPDARQVAFDPAHRRVWRICAACNEWNLLGAEAAAAALPELTARFAAAVPAGAGDEWLVPAQISDRLQLLRIGPAPVRGLGGSLSMRLRAEVNYRARTLRRSIYILAGGTVLSIAVYAIGLRTEPRAWSLAVAEYSVGILLFSALRKLTGRRASNWVLAVSAAVCVIASALVVTTLGFEHLRYMLVGGAFSIPILAAGFALTHRYMSVASATFADGTSVSLSKHAINRVRLGWPSGRDEVTFWFDADRCAIGADAVLLWHRLRVQVWDSTLGPGTAITERAYDLLRAVGGLHGLLHVLEGYRDERDGRVVVVDLPDIYLMALDLVLSARPEDDESQVALRDHVDSAARIAAVAESLDQ